MSSGPFVGSTGLNRTYKRDKDGKFASTGGVRDSLANAGTTAEVGAAAAAEAKRITGRDIEFDFAGSDPQIAAEHAEGILQGLERFPNASLVGVHSYGPGAAGSMGREIARQHPDAHAVTAAHGVMEHGKFVIQGNIYFNNRQSDQAMRDAVHAEGYLVTRTATGTALHEFGHVIANQTNAKRAVYDSAVELADRAGASPSAFIAHHVSTYAASNMGEFAAESFADVMTNGSGASAVSRAAFDVLESAYQGD